LHGTRKREMTSTIISRS